MSAVQRSSAADGFTVILWGAAAAVLTVISAIADFASTFTPDGLALTMRVDPAAVSAVIESTAFAVAGTATEMTVVSADVNAVSTACAAASILITALARLIIVGAATHLAWSFLRGRFFSPAVTRDLYVIGIAVIAWGLGGILFDRMAHNGMLTALGVEETEPLDPLEFWGITGYVFASVAIGLLALAFRRGFQLQRDTEGLL
ncbi:hypothetical protein [Microbacterium paludicola]|uniref:hypothetical protein n=1 Tax=Microbacterium paludicola TaxID=300019 RepID=UPI0031DD354F